MKRALLVGIDEYDNFSPLFGCRNDVAALNPLFTRNEDGAPNFSCETRVHPGVRYTRDAFLEDIAGLFAAGADVALLYFAGHGANTGQDVTLCAVDGTQQTPGVGLSEVLAMVVQSPVPEIIIVLDCCFSGAAGGIPQLGVEAASLRQGVSILAASRPEQPSAETPAGRGAFSTYLCGALEGGAADVLGKVTLAGVYAYLSESFGPWDQRPMFKANVDRLHELRLCRHAVPLEELRELPTLFPDPDYEFPLDPSYEPTEEPRDEEHERVFGLLQRCRAAKLVEPVGVEHMYFAAMQNGSCVLTRLGQHYRKLAAQDRI